MFSCNGNKCGNKTNITANNWTKCRCEIYSKEENTKDIRGETRTITQVKNSIQRDFRCLYKGLYDRKWYFFWKG